MKIGIGYCHGTFGELVQGIINEKDPFLIPLPIQLYSKAVFLPRYNVKEIEANKNKCKASFACQLLLDYYQLNHGGHLVVQSQLPTGKGMASSSADIVASLRAVADCLSLPLTEKLISEIATKIEPTDGIMYDEIVAYNYLNGTVIETFGKFPELLLFGVDIGGFIDTQQFNLKEKNYSIDDKLRLKKAYDLAKKGLTEGHISSIFKASMISAKINQKVLPKKHFEEMERLSKVYRGGLVVAHSGTVIGILMDPNKQNGKLKRLLMDIGEITGSPPFIMKVLT
ncbi:hypothetical protein BKP45_14125 [Anaerobacillus alkalidiazotrophicus]|uniref:GHMP kinase N-terminal domain-containing protein n=1 Tax=Anaerobacillus alkalidiazotrophicus TaxID=472963 RepID=A0A1S2M602_9BACI|nr:hypothetical protein [Anaerobacillus alkalidiazotrophicus]OIJ19287.1 hypothetical protein BKP45_14125 [Anaerobacillus alkalidiazotrophicus]